MFDPRLDVLPQAQREIWPELSAARSGGFVLYGGTAIALHLGHRQSVDFDFFRSEPLDKSQIRSMFEFANVAAVLQDAPDTLVLQAGTPSGPVKVSFFGGIRFGRVNDPLLTRDDVMFVASLDDLMATKLKATQDRAEAKDYIDIARMLSASASLARGIAAFQSMFNGEPSQVLRAIGYFGDGDLDQVIEADRALLRNARDHIGNVPKVTLKPGLLGASR